MNEFNLLNLQPSEKIKLIESIHWMHDLTADNIKAVSSYFKVYTAPGGAYLLKEGEKHDFVCILCEGSIDVIKTDFANNAKLLNSFKGTGKIFGEMSFFDGEASSASIVSKDTVKFIMLSKEEFLKMSSEHAYVTLKILVNLMRNLSQRLRQTSGRLVDVI